MAEGKFFEAEQQIMASVVQGHDTELLPADLMNEGHKIILEAAINLRDDGTVPDLITLSHEIEKFSNLEHIGGKDYLAKLQGIYPNLKRQEVYESIVKEQALRHKVIAHARAILHEEESGANTDDLIVMAQTQPMKLGAGKAGDNTSLAQDVAYDVLEEVQGRRGSNKLTGIETPWAKLNDMTAGLQKKDLIIIAGRPSMGKTALAGQIATHVALMEGPVFIGSLEMNRSSLVERMLVGAARIDGSKVRGGYITQEEYERLQIAAERLQDHHPIIINDSSRLTAQELRMAISQANLKYQGLKLAVVDYLGLVKEEDSRRSRYQEVGEVTRLMRATAKDLDIPVILVCQLNRECEQRDNKRPVLADLRESGDIEQDSDVIIMVYRDEYYCKDCNNPSKECTGEHEGIAELIVRKQRRGPVGTVTLTWQAEHTQFHNFERGDNYRDYGTRVDASDFAVPSIDNKPEQGSETEEEDSQRQMTF